MTSSGPEPYPQTVDGQSDILLAFDRTVRPARRSPDRLEAVETEPRLNISVVFTSVPSTLTALRQAATLASCLGARITLLAPQVVPYPLPLDQPPVLTTWNEKRFCEIADQSLVETRVYVYLCRDRLETLASVLGSGSIVVVGCRKRWWPTFEVRLARKLRRLGHEVILTEAE
jgi:hypothetical protein